MLTEKQLNLVMANLRQNKLPQSMKALIVAMAASPSLAISPVSTMLQYNCDWENNYKKEASRLFDKMAVDQHINKAMCIEFIRRLSSVRGCPYNYYSNIAWNVELYRDLDTQIAASCFGDSGANVGIMDITTSSISTREAVEVAVGSRTVDGLFPTADEMRETISGYKLGKESSDALFALCSKVLNAKLVLFNRLITGEFSKSSSYDTPASNSCLAKAMADLLSGAMPAGCDVGLAISTIQSILKDQYEQPYVPLQNAMAGLSLR